MLEMRPISRSDVADIFGNHSYGNYIPNEFFDAVDSTRVGDTLRLHSIFEKASVEDFKNLSVQTRFALLRKIGPKPKDATPEILEMRDYMAGMVLATMPYGQAYETFENEWIKRLLNTDPVRGILEGVKSNSVYEPSAYLRACADIGYQQINTFNSMNGINLPCFTYVSSFMRPKTHDTTTIMPSAVYFSTPCTDEEKAKLYPELTINTERMVSINMHADAGPLNAVRLVTDCVHEVAHCATIQASKLEGDNNPLRDVMDGFKGDFASYAWVQANFAHSVYQLLLTERLARSAEKKFLQLISIKAHCPEISDTEMFTLLKSEKDIHLGTICSIQEGWARKLSAKLTGTNIPAALTIPQTPVPVLGAMAATGPMT